MDVPCPFCEWTVPDDLPGTWRVLARHILVGHRGHRANPRVFRGEWACEDRVQCWCGRLFAVERVGPGAWAGHLQIVGGPVAHLLALKLGLEDK